ncbi:MAG TPA: hypothetical protein VGT41_05390 [Candidatus Babeliales bacterium]|nr:hypothetical protein [Candidatus Babeliales bacterium]
MKTTAQSISFFVLCLTLTHWASPKNTINGRLTRQLQVTELSIRALQDAKRAALDSNTPFTQTTQLQSLRNERHRLSGALRKAGESHVAISRLKR